MKDSLASTANDVRQCAKASNPGLIERLFARWFRPLRYGRLTFEFPSARRMTFEGTEPGPNALIRVRNRRMVSRIMASGDIGFAEGYIEGDWDTPDLKSVLMLGAMNLEPLSKALESSWLVNMFNRLRHARHANTKKGSRRNIAAHYDLGNAFYERWLDKTMSYSSALFAEADESHIEAQLRKYRRLAHALDLRPGDRVLEIGCGWGGFAEVAATEFGCEVVGLTLSTEQAAFARERMERLGVADKVEILLQDYRDVTGQFDKIVSIEMFEAVGEENWGTYFQTLDRCLKPGGKAGLQAITINDEHFDSYRRKPDFIQLYVFPGGVLPSPSAFGQVVSGAGLHLSDSFYFGASYAESLRRWADAFRENWDEIKEQGFDERFYLMWRYYLCYCEVGFDLGRIDVGQFVIERP
jgi:cyclopropane-fatty-acyl-phospholipid synthase